MRNEEYELFQINTKGNWIWKRKTDKWIRAWKNNHTGISSSIGKKVLDELFENPRSPKDIIKEKGWIQISDENAIKDVVLQVLSANPQSIADFKAGKDRALGFLVGQAMKATKGRIYRCL